MQPLDTAKQTLPSVNKQRRNKMRPRQDDIRRDEMRLDEMGWFGTGFIIMKLRVLQIQAQISSRLHLVNLSTTHLAALSISEVHVKVFYKPGHQRAAWLWQFTCQAVYEMKYGLVIPLCLLWSLTPHWVVSLRTTNKIVYSFNVPTCNTWMTCFYLF